MTYLRFWIPVILISMTYLSAHAACTLSTPSISTNSSTTICQGQTVTLSSTTGAGYQYQWLKNEVPIPGADNDTYDASEEGDYTVRVTLDTCSKTSAISHVTVNSIPHVSISNDVTICAGDTVTLQATGSGNFLWSNGANTAEIDVHPTSTKSYSVTVTNASFCSNTANVTVNVIPLPAASVWSNGSTTLCQGQSITLSVASGADSYQWYKNNSSITGATNNDHTTSLAGDYTVVVTDNGCTNISVPKQVVVNPLPVVSISNDIIVCSGDSVMLHASGGTSYNWSSGGPSTPDFPLVANFTRTYNVTVTNSLGCSDIASVTVTAKPLPQTWTSTSSSTALCQGQSVNISTSNTVGYSYQWTKNKINIPGANNNSYSASEAGSYEVIVVHNGCTDISDPVEVTVNPLPEISVSNDVTTCAGDTVTLSATGNGNFLWSLGATTSSITVNPTNTKNYSVTITDANGCQSNESVTVNVIPLASSSVSTSGTTTLCDGQTVTLSAINNADSYQWFQDNNIIPGAINNSYTANQSGNYNALVIKNGCTNLSNTVDVTVNPLPVAAASNDTTICAGDTITLFASGGTSYNWSSGGPDDSVFTVTTNNTRTYSVTVTNDFGCSDQESIVVTTIPLPQTWTSTSNSTTLCQGQSVTINTSNSAGYAYQWTKDNNAISGANNYNHTVSDPGSYKVQVTANGCSDISDPVNIIVNPLPVISVSNDTTTCAGDTVILHVTGTGNFLWNIGSTDSIITVNPTTTKTYSVSVSDGNDCESTEDVTVNVISLHPSSISTSGSTTLCQGQSITLSAIGGADTYQWYKDSVSISGANTKDYTTTERGFYHAVIMANGCINISNVVEVNVNPLPIATVSNDTTVCAGSPVMLHASGGTSYQWSGGGPAAPDFIVATSFPRTYNVTVTNDFGCSINESVTINTISLPQTWTSTSSSTTICDGESVTISTSNTTGYTYQWTKDASNIFGANSSNYEASIEGTYAVIVTASGCSKTSDFVEVTVNPIPMISTSNDTTICSGDPVTLNVSGNGNYLWSIGSVDPSITVNPNFTKTYSVSVTDINGCSNSRSITVSTIPLPNASISTSGTTTFCEGKSVNLNANSSTGYSYQWINQGNEINGATAQSLHVEESGIYQVIVTANSCSKISPPTTVTVDPLPNITISNDTTVCSGSAVNLQVSGGLEYDWNTGHNGSTYLVRPFNNKSYSVTVTNDYNCSASENVEITTIDLPEADLIISGNTSLCNGDTVILSTNILPGVSYQWMDGINVLIGKTTPTYLAQFAGDYHLQVTDNATGCINYSDTAQIVVNSNPLVTLNNDTTVCAGEPVVLEAHTIGGKSFLWTNNVTDSINVVSPATTRTYAVTVTNAFGCSSSRSVFISVIPAPNASITTSNSTNICQGESVTLNATVNGAYNYQWQRYGVNLTGANNASYTASIPGIYTVEISAFGCTKVSPPTNVVVNPNPTITVTNDTTICDGNTVTLTATGGTLYDWSNGQSGQDNPVSPNGNVSYSVTVTNANGCSKAANIRVTVLPSPTANITTNTTTNLCEGDTVILTALFDSNYVYQWLKNSDTISGAENPVFYAHETGSYKVQVSLNTCSKISNSTPVTVSPRPTGTISNDTAVCSGSSVTLTATGGNGYSWSTGAGTSSITVSPFSSRTYSVSISNGTQCKDIKSTTVTVNSVPNAFITVNGSPSICDGQAVTMNANSGSGYIYQWLRDAAIVPGADSIQLHTNIPGNYTVKISSNGCSKESQSKQISVNPLPVISISEDTIVCEQAPVTLIVSGGESYQWNTWSKDSIYTVTNSISKIYVVTATNSYGCEATDSVNIDIIPAPNVSITTNSTTTICEGDEVVLNANTSAPSFQWRRNGVNIPGGTNSTFTAKNYGSYTVVASENGCSKTSTPTNVNLLPSPPTPEIIKIGADTLKCNLTAANYRWLRNGAIYAVNTQIIKLTKDGTYSVIIFDNNCLSDTSAPYYNNTQSIGDIHQELNFTVYPNPNEGIFTISLSNVMGETISIELINALGESILKKELQSYSKDLLENIYVKDQIKGIYFLDIQTENQRTISKVIVN